MAIPYESDAVPWGMPTTRLAPSPTGALHLGNARTFLINWAMARQAGWQVVLRIEDLDGPRIRANAAEEAIETLTWLGLDWDSGPFFQALDTTPYVSALRQLIAAGQAYPCRCTRSQIAAASEAGEHDLRYPGTCRPELNSPPPSSEAIDEPGTAWRVVTPDKPIAFVDQFVGSQLRNPQQEIGDFLITTKGGPPSYQLAVVVDDARQGVNRVVRGDDLLSSTPRQILLYRLLDLGPLPEYTHLPIIVGPDGRKLAKRHGDSRLASYRERGVTPERVVGLLAEWSGLGPRRPMSAAEFAGRFTLESLPTEPVTFGPDDDAWLQATH